MIELQNDKVILIATGNFSSSAVNTWPQKAAAFVEKQQRTVYALLA